MANFLLSPLSSEIGDLLGWTSNWGTGKSPLGPNLESRGLGHDNRVLLRQKFTDKKRRVSRCIITVQHPGLVCPRLRPLPSHSFHQTLYDLQVKLFIDCLTTWNKLMMNNTLPIKKLLTSPSHLSDSDVLFLLVATIFPHRRLQFCSNIAAVHPRFITCYDIFQKVFISIRTI